MRVSPNIHAGRDFPADKRIQLFKINLLVFQDIYGHAASDVYADQIWHDFITDGHCGADGAARAGMDIRHDAYFLPFDKQLIA